MKAIGGDILGKNLPFLPATPPFVLLRLKLYAAS
jgi:hypothetical protein